MARAVRHGAAALQPALPAEPAGLPRPGAGLRRAEAGDAGAARGARRAAGRRQRGAPPHPRRQRPLAGTRLVREYAGRGARGHRAAPTASSGRAGPTGRSPPSPAHITGTRWNGWTFFGLRNRRGGGMSRREKGMAALPGLPAKVRKLRCAVYTRKSTEEGLDKEFNTLDAQRDACEAYVASPARRGLGAGPRPLRRRRLLRRHPGAAGAAAAAGRHRGGPVDVVVVYKIDRLTPLADRLRQAGGGVRGARRDLRLGHAGLQHHDQHGPADAATSCSPSRSSSAR